MSDYIICVRNVRKGKYGTEPGPTKFLKLRGNELPNPTKKRQKLTQNDWKNEVSREASTGFNENSEMPTGDILVFIHGYNNNQKVVMQRHRQLKKDLADVGYKGAVVSFDWPSASSAINYLEDRSDAKITALRLVKDCINLFTITQSKGCELNVHLLAHSTGAYVIREAFDDADDRPKIALTNWSVSQICYIGADVSSKSMKASDSKSSSIYRHCARLTNYWNPYDSVLKLSNVKRVGVAPRVGRIGLPDTAPQKSVDVDCGDYFDSLDADNATFHGTFCHSWHVGDKLFAEDLMHTLAGDIDRNRIPTRASQNGRLVLTD